MTEPYRYPEPEAVATLNTLLDLPAHGQEQDWEIELADSDKLDRMLALLTGGDLDLPCRSALALLILFTLTYHNDGEAAALARAPTVRDLIQRDAAVRSRLLDYWSEGFQSNETAVAAILR